MTDQTPILRDYELSDRYTRTEGRVFLTGTQAILRIALDQARRDKAAGLDTRGFISGYRGSPVGGIDLEVARNRALVDAEGIGFVPAVNEELAATQIIGTQQVETDPDRTCAGVFGLWYGKGPGVDRAADALKHGNAYGSSPHGGVLVVAGDDHGCVSSSMPHQSDVAFMNFFMPTINPANVAEFLSFAEWGYALSRFSGMWVGFKAISETVESGMSFELPKPRSFVAPDYEPPKSGLHYRWPDLPGPQIEERMEAKKAAVLAFARANPIDRSEWGHEAHFGIVTTGKSHLDVLEALRLLGIDAARAAEIGLDIYKVGMVWPLEHLGALAFAKDKRELLVIEEKRGIIESQLKEYFYDFPGQKPKRMVGKRDEAGNRLIPWTHELGAVMLARHIAARLERNFPDLDLVSKAAHAVPAPAPILVEGAARTPYFCSGCPHNTSTKVPEGSQALAGIGCHFMASWMNRNTTSLIQMGGEGVNWVSRSRFNGNKHVFQNLGDGTYYHSGSLAVRQAIAAGTNITYKILYNDAVAMTGGQHVDGPLSVASIAQSMVSEGARKVVVVSDDPEALRREGLPAGVPIEHRRDLDRVQRELRDIPGTTVLIYQQTCATEKRRLRKRGKMEDPKKFAVINPLVCEGCGDCSVESNCLSVEPLETEFGRKRKINLNTCNKDFTCLNGFCPSFVTVEGATLKKTDAAGKEALAPLQAALPEPDLPSLSQPWDILVTGVGGTGVVTVGQLIAMAANLEQKGASVLDFMGFAQKFGPVLSYLRVAASEAVLNQVKIEPSSAHALIGCDLVVSSSPKASATYRKGETRAVINTAIMPTGDLVQNRDADLNAGARLEAIRATVDAASLQSFDANTLAEALLGDSVFANVMILGAAWQAGLVPLGLEALMRAIELNGVKPAQNKDAFTWGRVLVHDRGAVERVAQLPASPVLTLDEMIARRAEFLTGYQNAAWAQEYLREIGKVRKAETAATGAVGALTEAAAKGLFKLMSYKDEYEVARLHTQTGFQDDLAARFDGPFKLVHHMAPPVLAGGRDARGRPLKRAFGPWIRPAMRLLAKMKPLRGTALDPFGYSVERKMERALIAEYRALLDRLTAGLTFKNRDDRAAKAALVMDIRGFGPVKRAAAMGVRAQMAEISANNGTQSDRSAAIM
ncbi:MULTISPECIES: indolepyruvate ferredoxin oxidoreductase family protein [unclassified Salipiger]|uniref:indolepyruvate ferredoxin oxidoreductase family protein n=1 Tax=unclassified Salipiger TaxID=2640570 RepID=UPI0013B8D909|nr:MULTISPECIES: indolepyruvate ferredoxin oxidoreductase family protein [unclassified Salipiger]NDV48985.1 indolepyruvate ferredoxin oxidoreductase family protein [Salipiger sp. PrR003]NDW31248.1 indolepyruvate ferredoxin oxidoreductase family protein [Salipiger sp. PrR007]